MRERECGYAFMARYLEGDMLNPASSPPLIQHFCQVIPAGTLLSLETPSQAKALVI